MLNHSRYIYSLEAPELMLSLTAPSSNGVTRFQISIKT